MFKNHIKQYIYIIYYLTYTLDSHLKFRNIERKNVLYHDLLLNSGDNILNPWSRNRYCIGSRYTWSTANVTRARATERTRYALDRIHTNAYCIVNWIPQRWNQAQYILMNQNQFNIQVSCHRNRVILEKKIAVSFDVLHFTREKASYNQAPIETQNNYIWNSKMYRYYKYLKFCRDLKNIWMLIYIYISCYMEKKRKKD